MTKLKIYELAKELNTSSKRLMEKLGEIGINVKNHMSFLEDHELEALYKHIGFKKHDEPAAQPVKQEGAAPINPITELKKPATPHILGTPMLPHTPHIIPHSNTVPQAGAAAPHPVSKLQKSAPTIVRKRQIIVDTPADFKKETRQEPRQDNKGDVRVRKDDSDGLMPGFVRDSMPSYKGGSQKNQQGAKKPQQPPKTEPETAAARPQTPAEAPEQQVASVKPVNVPEPKPEAPIQATVSANAPETLKKGPVNKIPAEPTVKTPVAEVKQALAPKTEAPKTEPKTAEPDKSVKPEQTKTEPVQAQTPAPVPTQAQKPAPAAEQPAPEKPKPVTVNKIDANKPYQPRPSGGGYGASRGSDQYRGGQGGGRPAPYRNDGYDRQGSTGPGRYGAGGNSYSTSGGGGGYSSGGSQTVRTGGRPPMAGQLNRYGTGTQSSGTQGGGQGYRRDGGTGGYPPRDGAPRTSGPRYGGAPGQAPRFGATAEKPDDINRSKPEPKRESLFKVNKDTKRDDKKEQPRAGTADKPKKFVADKTMLSEKKGVHEVMSDEFVLDDMLPGSDKAKRLARNRKPGREDINVYIPHKAVLTSIKIPESLTVKELAESLKKTSGEIIKKLMSYGQLATLNQEIDIDTATIIAEDYGVKVEKELVVSEEDILFDDDIDAADSADLIPRPPVVVVMGHVDHGKTSLLDAIRKTNVIDSEAGGITQHIGAYMVKIHDRDITFLDTPGHEAFTSMRARGAQVTDIAVLVVAADDGIMPQTIEAINHAKAANVKIIVAINKIDKPGADPDRVRQELTKYELLAEEWGGDTICVNVSAKMGQNIDKLLEMIILVADMLELKADPHKQPKGTIIEARLDKGRGPIATMLVQRGTLKVGDSIVTGTTVGRIRAMTDDKGKSIKEAGPSTPVEIQGLPEVPEAGEIFHAISDEKIAKQLAEKRKLRNREQTLKAAPAGGVTLDDLFTQIQSGKVKELNIIVKADVQGSVEAVNQSLEKLSNDEVKVRIIHGGVGAINETDISLASVSNAIIIGFNVRPSANVADIAAEAGVDIRLYRVIYNAIEDIEAAMKGMLEPTFKEVTLGQAEIRQIFKVSGIGTIAGCYVTSGKIVRNSDVRIIRDGIVIHEGKLASLKRFKDDAKEVAQGFECGLSIDRFNDIKESDVVESYTMEEVKRA